MKVLSLFDGLSGGHISLDRAVVKVDKYYASEIDKYAMQVTMKNYPDTIQVGSVINLTDEQLAEMDIDLLIGGSPCQGFSLIGKLTGSATKCGKEVATLEDYLALKRMNFEFDGQSYLFWEYIRVLNIVKPKYFLLENVRINHKWLPMFNKAIGVKPVIINSALVSAQNRVRYYWTNIPDVEQPENKNIVLSDILYDKDVLPVSESSAIKYAPYKGDFVDPYNKTNLKGNKSTTLRTNSSNGNMWIKDIDSSVVGKHPAYRRLHPIECERLQTMPDGYTDWVSNSQRYKMIGNGFTIDVIAHIFKGLKDKQ